MRQTLICPHSQQLVSKTKCHGCPLLKSSNSETIILCFSTHLHNFLSLANKKCQLSKPNFLQLHQVQYPWSIKHNPPRESQDFSKWGLGTDKPWATWLEYRSCFVYNTSAHLGQYHWNHCKLCHFLLFHSRGLQREWSSWWNRLLSCTKRQQYWDSQPSNSAGGNLGVVDGKNAFNRFVGVEFDSYVNEWDPNLARVGIDVNSLISLKTEKWNRVSGSLVKVTITYESLTKTLSVSWSNGNIGPMISTVSQVVDLKAVLPEVVRVGLSATTTEKRETHDIHSWSFMQFNLWSKQLLRAQHLVYGLWYLITSVSK